MLAWGITTPGNTIDKGAFHIYSSLFAIRYIPRCSVTNPQRQRYSYSNSFPYAYNYTNSNT